MGRVLTEATVVNLDDLFALNRGIIAESEVRRVRVPDALVDTGATMLALPTRFIKQLGLTRLSTKRITSTTGAGQADMYGTVRLTIQGRDFTTDVMEVPDNVPVLIGQIPLEALDFVIDPRAQKLTGNPAHGGEHLIEMY